VSRLREYRERFVLTQDEVVAAIRKRALARGDVAPGLDRPALSKGHKRPGPYYQTLYCEVYGATPAELGIAWIFIVVAPWHSQACTPGAHERVRSRAG